jgi:hypothetical protein
MQSVRRDDMKISGWIILGVFAIILIALVLFFAVPSFHGRDMGLEQRLFATNSLRNACMELAMDSLPKPDGEGCTSISNAVNFSLRQDENAFTWGMTSKRTNTFIYLNPDWDKWTETATNQHAFIGELAAYCSPGALGTNKNLFLGITFDQQFIALTNPPSWPRAVDLVPQ